MINPANPVGAFLQGRGMAQQQQATQQGMDLQRQQNDRANRAEQRGIEATQQQRQQWLAENLPDALAYSDTPEKWDQSVAYLESLGFNEAAQFRGRFDMRDALLAQVQGSQSARQPASVLEHQYYLNLPTDEARAEFMNLQRSGNLVMVGNVPHYRNADGSLTALSTLDREREGEYALSEAKTAGAVPTGTQRGPDGRISPQPGAPLSPQTETRLVESTAAANQARSNAQYYSSLADELAARMPPGGVAGEWAASLRSLTGSENADDLLRRRWAEVRVSNAIQNLPPGVASDKDIELVMSAFLPTYANADTISSFVRGLAKIEELQAEYHEFEADWYSQNGTARGLSQAWRQHLEQRTGNQPGGGQQNNEQNSDPLGIRGR